MDFETLLDMRRHINVAHHVPGRIRLKFRLSVLGDKRAYKALQSAGDYELPEGVNNYRLNIPGRSLVVEYDSEIIDPDKLQEVLTTGDNARFGELAEEFKALLPLET